MPTQPVSNDVLPVVNVTWQEAADYAAWAGKRLPTEAEYEYVMRGGAAYSIEYPFGANVTAGDANYNRNVMALTPVSNYPATGPGVYNIAGNAWEWCSDWHQDVLSGPVVDPAGPGTGSKKIIRGGCWVSFPEALKVYTRYNQSPTMRSAGIGFRCVKSAGSSGAPDPDNNSNGLPDWWESWYFGGSCNSSEDSDGDGLINWQEFVIGSNPTNAGSVLSVQTTYTPVPADEFTIQWPSVQGRLYTIERSADLMTWAPIANNIVATPLMNSYLDSPGGSGPYFYRVVVQP